MDIDKIEYKVIDIRQELNKNALDSITGDDIILVLNRYAKDNWTVKTSPSWDIYLLERKIKENDKESIVLHRSKLGRLNSSEYIAKIENHLHDYFVGNGDEIFCEDINNPTKKCLNNNISFLANVFIDLINKSKNSILLINLFKNMITELEKRKK